MALEEIEPGRVETQRLLCCSGFVSRKQPDAQARAPLALYVRIPFCRSLCWYCGCHVKISRNDRVTIPYLAALDQELQLVSQDLALNREISQMHWGGGTLTYQAPDQIETLVGMIKSRLHFQADAELSIEVDPRVTRLAHLQALRRSGFFTRLRRETWRSRPAGGLIYKTDGSP